MTTERKSIFERSYGAIFLAVVLGSALLAYAA